MAPIKLWNKLIVKDWKVLFSLKSQQHNGWLIVRGLHLPFSHANSFQEYLVGKEWINFTRTPGFIWCRYPNIWKLVISANMMMPDLTRFLHFREILKNISSIGLLTRIYLDGENLSMTCLIALHEIQVTKIGLLNSSNLYFNISNYLLVHVLNQIAQIPYLHPILLPFPPFSLLSFPLQRPERLLRQRLRICLDQLGILWSREIGNKAF